MRRVVRISTRVLLGVLIAAGTVYAAEDISVRYRVSAGLFDEVHTLRFLAVPEKFNKTDYERLDPVTERCIRSLLPHLGYRPCWYVNRHRVVFIDVG